MHQILGRSSRDRALQPGNHSPFSNPVNPANPVYKRGLKQKYHKKRRGESGKEEEDLTLQGGKKVSFQNNNNSPVKSQNQGGVANYREYDDGMKGP
jgi:hypothetical protein